MTDQSTPQSAGMSGWAAKGAVLAAAVVVAAMLAFGGQSPNSNANPTGTADNATLAAAPSTDAPPPRKAPDEVLAVIERDDPAKFDFLEYVDARVAEQECRKDVRCWSSLQKLQMFLAGIAIEPEAVAARVEQYVELMDSILADAAAEADGEHPIDAAALQAVLERRFPHTQNAEDGAQFDLGGGFNVIKIESDAVEDYSDTIEPWRLIQTWASRRTDADTGELSVRPMFNREAADKLCEFVRVYDLAILRHARDVAHARKESRVDEASMVEAFELESRLQRDSS